MLQHRLLFGWEVGFECPPAWNITPTQPTRPQLLKGQKNASPPPQEK